ncbi:hypothetical protein QBC46DRAFT_365679 [Diplogelasinospora grovesii]|uniref:Uncharacterized protein n=1 Tax=Diplogelasinospora grovesii TaxID=303347 RepID=A0AAN6N2V8_9PEZI|nr:hypothetical protein QBC46DRAFT_365679 [Diplogelasinospora grovesii]
MKATRRSSLERRRWREKCRELLADHIRKRISITLEPSDRVVPHIRHLFTKQLSDHTLRAYKDLCEGVRVTFEAVPCNRRSITPPIGSEQLNAELMKEISDLRDRLALKMECSYFKDASFKYAEGIRKVFPII